ncbi:MAG: hypothetical protein GY913_12365 [Proteobacteria bacterium]|nr:hypothetical protein [Pseudomonadota bacterium]MCP4917710.1 hypothetical protein [Pseudomonadota bacterium]
MFLLLACTATPPDEVVPVEELVPSEYIYEESEPPVPTLSAEDVGLAVEEALAVALAIDVQPLLDGYDAVLESEEEGCPDYYESEGNTYWYDYCTTEDGAYFSGYGFGYVYEDYLVDGYSYNGQQVYAIAELYNPDGSTWEGGGSLGKLEALYVEEDNVPHTIGQMVMNGAFAYDGPEASGTWLETDLVPDLTVLTYNVPENEVYPTYLGNVLIVQGGITGLGGTADTVVLDVSASDAALGNACAEELSGTVSVRDNDGLWYDVTFHGVEAFSGDPVDAEDCDGCGDIWFRGEFVGEACLPDATGLLGWEGAVPW